MKKGINIGFKWLEKFKGFGAGVILTIISYAALPFYIWMIELLGWRAFLVFPPIAGFIAWGMIHFFAEEQKTLEETIEEKVKGKRKKKILLSLFNKSKFLAFGFAALFLGPYLAPLIIRSCTKRTKRAYLYSVLLNVFATAFWILSYLGGIEAIKGIFKI